MTKGERVALIAGVELRTALRDALETPGWAEVKRDAAIQLACAAYDVKMEEAGYLSSDTFRAMIQA